MRGLPQGLRKGGRERREAGRRVIMEWVNMAWSGCVIRNPSEAGKQSSSTYIKMRGLPQGLRKGGRERREAGRRVIMEWVNMAWSGCVIRNPSEAGNNLVVHTSRWEGCHRDCGREGGRGRRAIMEWVNMAWRVRNKEPERSREQSSSTYIKMRGLP